MRDLHKRNRIALIGAMLAIVLALGAVSTAQGAGIHFLHCGTLRGTWAARYSIVADRANCITARGVFGAFFAGKGRRRMDPFTTQIDKVVNGWLCGPIPGGFSCTKLGPHGMIPPQLGPNIEADVI